MPRKAATIVELRLRTDDPAVWQQADEVMANLAAVPGVASVVAKKRCDHYMDLDLDVRLEGSSKAELRRLYNNVSRVADNSAFRFAGRQCVLNDMF